MLPRFVFLLSLLFAARADEELSESEILDKVFQFYAFDDASFLSAAQQMLPSFVLLARTQLELAENLSAVEPSLVEKFKVFNTRLARRTEAFRHFAQKMDAEDTHLKLLGTMKVMEKIEQQRLALLTSGDPTDLDLVQQFDDAFDEGMVIITDALFAAFYNQHGKGDQLLAVGVKLLHRHPRLSQLFMRSCVELLLHAFVLEATHLQVTGQPAAAVLAFDKRSKERFALVIKTVFAERSSLGDGIREQIKKDQLRFHEQSVGLEHCDFAEKLVKYLADKYPRLACFVHSYEPVTGWESHAVYTYGSHIFRVGERNSVVDCRDLEDLQPSFSQVGRKVLDAVDRKRKASSRYASRILDAVGKKLEEAGLDYVAVTVVRSYAQGCYKAPFGQVAAGTKKTYKCNTKLCWVKKSYDFNVVLFG